MSLNDIGNGTSTKILQPPGGASSDIFGNDESKQTKATKNRMESNIFGADTPIGAQPCAAPQPSGPESSPAGGKGRSAEGTRDRVFGEPEVIRQESKNLDPWTPEKRSLIRKGHSTFNPITGLPYEDDNEESSQDDKATAQATSTRCRQPPGGASSKLW